MLTDGYEGMGFFNFFYYFRYPKYTGEKAGGEILFFYFLGVPFIQAGVRVAESQKTNGHSYPRTRLPASYSGGCAAFCRRP